MGQFGVAVGEVTLPGNCPWGPGPSLQALSHSGIFPNCVQPPHAFTSGSMQEVPPQGQVLKSAVRGDTGSISEQPSLAKVHPAVLSGGSHKQLWRWR